jgi:hypothetical protein
VVDYLSYVLPCPPVLDCITTQKSLEDVECREKTGPNRYWKMQNALQFPYDVMCAVIRISPHIVAMLAYRSL